MNKNLKDYLYIIGFVIILIVSLLDISNIIKAITIITLFILACIIRFIIPTTGDNK